MNTPQTHDEREQSIRAVARDLSDRTWHALAERGGQFYHTPDDLWNHTSGSRISVVREFADAGHIVGIDRLYEDYPEGQVRISPSYTWVAIRGVGGQSDYAWEAVNGNGVMSSYRDGDVRDWRVLHTPTTEDDKGDEK